jgi:hypothetical protein
MQLGEAHMDLKLQPPDQKGNSMTSSTALRGLVAGVAGVAAMTVAEKVEQALTGRPNSFVPAHTLERLLRLPHKPDDERLGLNWTMHWGQGILLGTVRSLMAARHPWPRGFISVSEPAPAQRPNPGERHWCGRASVDLAHR